jgi:transposase
MKTMCAAEERLEFWNGVLQLDEFEVVHQAEDVAEKTLRFTVITRIGAAVCPHCGGLCTQTQQTRDRDGIRDLPIGERAVVLRVRVREFFCDACERCFTPPFESIAAGTHATERFLERAASMIRHSDIANAARLCGLPERTLARWYYDFVERQQSQPPAELKPITSIGIDELSQKKGTASSWR